MKIDTIIFDLGGVLIDWNPRYLYQKIFDDEKQMEWFLENVCNSNWNVQQDAGRKFEEAIDQILPQFPQFEYAIRSYYERWEEMLAGPLSDTVTILEELLETKKHRLLALTNWSHQTFPIARERFDFLGWFEDILVSGEEKMKKPDLEIYQLLIDRYSLTPERSLFIDDSLKNVEAAADVGIKTIHFQTSEQLNTDLRKWL